MNNQKLNKKTFKNTLLLWLPVILWATIIFTLSSMHTLKVTEIFLWDFFLKKSAHVIEFGILFALTYRASRRKWILSVLICLLYAVSDEFHQSFVLGRSASVFDLAFDMSGINIAAYTIWKLKTH